MDQTRTTTGLALRTRQSGESVLNRNHTLRYKVDRQGAVDAAGYGVLINAAGGREKPGLHVDGGC